jgi:uncharacterized protein YbjT (DUF2867 family)
MTGGDILVAGGTGFVGRRLVTALTEAGHRVRVMTRHPEQYDGDGTAVHGDVSAPETLARPLDGCSRAYYLVHSLDRADFEDQDARAATAFATAASAAGIAQIVYLGGLGSDSDDLSPHLRSRRDVERILASAGVPVTVLRAGIVIGHGGISWEITRQLVEHLPAMVTPRWVSTRTQPIAITDVVRYLLGVLDNPAATGRTFEIGGPDVLRYSDMLKVVAGIEGRPLPIVPVPLLTPRLSSLWLSLVTDVDTRAGRNLIDSMRNTVVVTDHSIESVVPLEPLTYAQAVRLALAERNGLS